MVDIDSFSVELTDNISKRCKKDFGEDCTVISKDVDKLNGVKLHGITISREGSKISPIIYAENYYDMYAEGKQFDEIIDSVMDSYRRYSEIKPAIDDNMLSDWDYARDKISARLINYETNKEMLEELPHIRFLDLAVIFDMKGDHTSFGTCSVRITNHLMDLWGISLADLESAFNENFSRTGIIINPMSEIIGKFLTESLVGGYDTSCPLCVMGTNDGVYGAISMVRKDKIKDFAERIDSDVYIIPSSVHELILCPANESINVQDINSLIKEVNRTSLEPMEVLSDHAYFYSRELDEISMV